MVSALRRFWMTALVASLLCWGSCARVESVRVRERTLSGQNPEDVPMQLACRAQDNACLGSSLARGPEAGAYATNFRHVAGLHRAVTKLSHISLPSSSRPSAQLAPRNDATRVQAHPNICQSVAQSTPRPSSYSWKSHGVNPCQEKAENQHEPRAPP